MSSSPPPPSPDCLLLLRPSSQDKLLNLAFVGTAGNPDKKGKLKWQEAVPSSYMRVSIANEVVEMDLT